MTGFGAGYNRRLDQGRDSHKTGGGSLVISAVAIACLIVGFFAGGWWSDRGSDINSDIDSYIDLGAESVSAHSQSRSPGKVDGKSADPRAGQSAGSALQAAQVVPVVTSLAETADISSEFLQSAALYALAAPMTAEELRELIDSAKSALIGGDYAAGTSLLIGRFAELDFSAALDYALNNGGASTTRWLQSIFHARARIDVDEAVTVAADLGRTHQRIAGIAILRSNDRLSLAERQTIVETLEVPGQMVAATRHSKADAWSELRNIGDPMQRTNAQMQVLMSWGRDDPWAALDASGEISSGQMRDSVQGMLLGLAAPDDTQRVIDWLNRLPEGERRNSLAAAAATAAGATDFDSAQRLLEQLPEASRYEAEFGLWTQRAASDPEGAAAWVGSLATSDATSQGTLGGQGVMKQLAGTQILAVLGMMSTESADRFVNALPAATRVQLEPTYIEGLARQNPQQAVIRLEGIADQEQRFAAAERLVSSWTQRDPEAASRWVEGQSSVSSAKLYNTLGASWAQKNPKAAKAYGKNMRSGIGRDQMLYGTLMSGRVTGDDLDQIVELIDDPELRAQGQKMKEMRQKAMSRAQGMRLQGFSQ